MRLRTERTRLAESELRERKPWIPTPSRLGNGVPFEGVVAVADDLTA